MILMTNKSDDMGATITVWWDEVGSVSLTVSPEDWNDIQLGEEDVEIDGEGCVLEGREIQDRWIFRNGEDGVVIVAYVDDEYDYVVGVEKDLKDTEIVEHPTPHRKPRENEGFWSHEEMTTLIKKGSYSTRQGCIGESDTRPYVVGRFVVPVAYVEDNIPNPNTSQRFFCPEGDILGYLRNAVVGDRLIFPGKRSSEGKEPDEYAIFNFDDAVYDFTDRGWVKYTLRY